MDRGLFIEGFEKGNLPAGQWSHLGHLRVALHYCLATLSEEEAMIQIRCGLIRYGALSTPGITCNVRYHETKTLFWIKQVRKFIASNSDKNYDELVALIRESELISKDYILNFYDEDVLESTLARAFYIEPTKQKA